MPAIATLSWVPRVLNSDRVQHERQGVLDGLPDHHIKDMDRRRRRMTVAPERSEYYPIFYATVPKTSKLYGLDLGSEADTLAELDHSRDADRLGFSPVPALVSTDRTQGGFLFSLPIYKRGSLHDTIENRRRNLAGFVHGSVIAAKMVNDIISETKRPKVSICFSTRPSGGRKPCRLHASFAASHLAARVDVSRRGRHRFATGAATLEADGQPWLTMVARPMPGGPLIAHHDRAWIVLVSGSSSPRGRDLHSLVA